MVELFSSQASRHQALRTPIFGKPRAEKWVVDSIHHWALTRDFRKFRNGGLTLFERRLGPLIEEITLSIAGTHEAPRMILQLYVSHSALAELRGLSQGRLGHVSTRVAGGDLGPILHPGSWAAIDCTAQDPRGLEIFMEQYVGPWLDCWPNSLGMLDTLFAGQFPLVGPRGAVEWILVEFGPSIAERYLSEVALQDQEEWNLVQESLRRLARRERRFRPHVVAELVASYGLHLRQKDSRSRVECGHDDTA